MSRGGEHSGGSSEAEAVAVGTLRPRTTIQRPQPPAKRRSTPRDQAARARVSKGRPKGLTASRACPLEGAAQVVSLNGVIASQAVTEVLQLLTGFGGAGLRRSHFALPHEPDIQRGSRNPDGVRGTLADWGATHHPDCPLSASALGAGAKLP